MIEKIKYPSKVFSTEDNSELGTPFITYIIATYNCVGKMDILKKTVLSLDGLPIEFIVSDGGSEDGTLEALRGLSNIKIACSTRDEGIYDAWNRAIPYAKGKYIGFIGVDDIPQKEFVLEAMKKDSNSSSDIALMYGDVCLVRKNRYRKIINPLNPKLFLSESPFFDISHQGALHAKYLFDKYRFDKKYKLAGDFHFLIKMRQLGLINSFEKMNALQAVVAEEGVSRSEKAWSIMLNEYRLIEEELKIKIGCSKIITLLAAFRYAPWLFFAIKNIVWAIRGKRVIHVDSPC